jgi:thiamine-monophosphate kinase
MRERERIARFFAPLTDGEPGSYHLTDDAALLEPPAGKKLVITTDSVIEGIHVLPGATPEQYAVKLMRRNLSDLAAMGATPWRYTLNLHTPPNLPDTWFAEFAATLAEEQQQFGLVLIGGDSTSGPAPIHTTLTCFGVIDGHPLRRRGAHAGDDIYVSGTIGDAALGLLLLQQKSTAMSPLIERYHQPQPRLSLGQALRAHASAAIDISDGLLTDLAHLIDASHVGAAIYRERIPLSPAAQQMLQHNSTAWDAILNGGDDYELCFTAPPTARTFLHTFAGTLSLPLTRIGSVSPAAGLTLYDHERTALPLSPNGWEHS